jgi:hypothetical protein
MSEAHVELLVGARVVDVDGRAVGRIEDFVADREEDGCTVREVHLGAEALLRRLAVSASRLPFLGWLERHAGGCRVPWDRLDLGDPERPRLTCRRDELSS